MCVYVGGSGSWGLCDIHSHVRTFVLCHTHHYFKRLQQCNAANMQGKVIDSRIFTQANICSDYTKFLRLLNAMPVRFLYFMHPSCTDHDVHIYECVPTACNVTSYIYILGTDLRAAFGRASSAILVCAIYLLFHWQRRVMSINIFFYTLRLLYM